MNGKQLLKTFGFSAESEPASIYPYSPVYHVQNTDGDFIIKRTQHLLKNGEHLMNYTRMLAKRGISVVTPVSLNVENPRVIGDETYVVYPFIGGEKYDGNTEQIYQSGKLLGNMHALSPIENTFHLDPFNVFDFDHEEVTESMEKITKLAAGNVPSIDFSMLGQTFTNAVARQEALQKTPLPWIATPYDYKANNLIFTPEPYLIDPDNAYFAPRIFDLALALLLFHNEMDTAPDHVFTIDEWAIFMKGYRESVHLTDLEKIHWRSAVEHIFLDEVMWLMAEAEDDWKNPAQQRLFASLSHLMQDFSVYTI